MKKVRSCGVIPVWVDKKTPKVLLLKSKKYGHWMFPKGRQESGESDKQTAKREFVEESGVRDFYLVADKVFEEAWVYEKSGEKIDKTGVYFLAMVGNNDLNLQAEEISEGRWVELPEGLDLLEHDSKKKILEDVFAYLHQMTFRDIV